MANGANPPQGTGVRFQDTHWSVVLAARQSDSPQARTALERLCRTYWYPLYAFLRRRGHAPHDAQDVTQEFFCHLLETDLLKAADPQKGKFRTFLLACLEHVARGQWDQQRAQKRGGGREVISWDAVDAEGRYRLEPPDETTPQNVFDRRWAAALIEKAMQTLRQEYAASGKAELFDELRPSLTAGAQARGSGRTASQLKMSDGAWRVALLRLRRRFREMLREEVAHTVAEPAAVDEELRYLFAAWSS